jgi:hypothetical protein
MATTFHHSPIIYENLEVVNQINETMESYRLGDINEVIGVSTIYEQYIFVVFNVSLDFENLWSGNTR